MEILRNFGIQPVLLLAQIVNFLIILFLLSKFFYKPVVKMLDSRKTRIEESLKNAEQIEEKLKNTQEQSAKIIADAQKNAQDLITEAKNQAEKIIDDASIEARKSMEEAVKSAQEQISAQRQQAVKDVQAESLSIIAAVVKKVIGRTASQTEKNQLTKEAISQLQKQM